MMLAKVFVTLKAGVLDPQGTTIQHALASVGFASIDEVRMGKYFEIKLKETEQAQAAKKVERICEELLSNPVIENYRYEIIPQ